MPHQPNRGPTPLTIFSIAGVSAVLVAALIGPYPEIRSVPLSQPPSPSLVDPPDTELSPAARQRAVTHEWDKARALWSDGAYQNAHMAFLKAGHLAVFAGQVKTAALIYRELASNLRIAADAHARWSIVSRWSEQDVKRRMEVDSLFYLPVNHAWIRSFVNDDAARQREAFTLACYAPDSALSDPTLFRDIGALNWLDASDDEIPALLLMHSADASACSVTLERNSSDGSDEDANAIVENLQRRNYALSLVVGLLEGALPSNGASGPSPDKVKTPSERIEVARDFTHGIIGEYASVLNVRQMHKTLGLQYLAEANDYISSTAKLDYAVELLEQASEQFEAYDKDVSRRFNRPSDYLTTTNSILVLIRQGYVEMELMHWDKALELFEKAAKNAKGLHAILTNPDNEEILEAYEKGQPATLTILQVDAIEAKSYRLVVELLRTQKENPSAEDRSDLAKRREECLGLVNQLNGLSKRLDVSIPALRRSTESARWYLNYAEALILADGTSVPTSLDSQRATDLSHDLRELKTLSAQTLGLAIATRLELALIEPLDDRHTLEASPFLKDWSDEYFSDITNLNMIRLTNSPLLHTNWENLQDQFGR